MNKLSNQNIKDYIDILVENFGVHSLVNEKELREDFDLDLCTDLVYKITKIMGLNNKTKVSCSSGPNHHYCKNGIKVLIMRSLVNKTDETDFESLGIRFEVESSLKKNFELFVKIITQQLSILMLHRKGYETSSETITELCTLIFGFDYFFLYPTDMPSLTEDQMKFAVAYIEEIRKN